MARDEEFPPYDGSVGIDIWKANRARELKLDAEIADQVLRASRESIKVLRDRLDIGRSLNSAIKSEWSAQGAGQAMAA